MQKNKNYLTPQTDINSKWTEDLNIRPETIKLLGHTGSQLPDISLGDEVMIFWI